MKRKIRILVFLLALLMMAASVAACKPKRPAETETNEELPPEQVHYDWDGAEFTFMERDLEASTNIYYELHAESLNADFINNALFTRNKAIEEMFNISLKSSIESTVNGTRRTKLEQYFNAGDDVYSVVMDYGGNTMVYSINGHLYDLNQFDAFDFGRSYWYTETMEDTQIGGKNTFAVGDICTASYTATCAIFYNKSLGQTFGVPNLYDLVFDGDWTFEAFSTVGKDVTNDLNGNGEFDANDRYMLAAANWAYQPYFYGQGFTLLDKDKNGNPVMDSLSESEHDALEAIVKLVNSNDCWYLGKYPDDVGTFGVFNDQRALFWAQLMVGAGKLRNCSFDFGILPLPKGSSDQERYVSYLHTKTSLLSIPTTNRDAERTSILIEQMCADSEKLIKPQYFDVLFDGIIARDPETVRTLDIIYDNVFMDLVQPLGQVGLSLDTTLRNIMDYGLYSALTTSWNKAVTKNNGAIDSVVTAYKEKVK